MCHESRERRRETAEQEETRRFWDAFRRETAEPPVAEPEVRLDGEDAATERPAEPVER